MISTREATERYSKVGVVKGNLPTLKMLVLGIVAGFFISIAGTGAAAAGAGINLSDRAAAGLRCAYDAQKSSAVRGRGTGAFDCLGGSLR